MNGRRFRRVIIDPHYELKHRSTVNDEIILALVQDLNGRVFVPAGYDLNGSEYFVRDPAYLYLKPYRLVWVLHPDHDYVGIVNCFRRSRGRIPKSQND
jgi:hypothetical protein